MRVSRPAQALLQIRRVMHGIDADVPLEHMRALDDQVRWNIRKERIVMQLAATFAMLATALVGRLEMRD